MPRSGSHMLATALDSHPDLSIAGEVFVRPFLFNLKDTIPTTLVEETLRNFNGFVAHRTGGWLGKYNRNNAWNAIRKANLKVIFLSRFNLIAQFASIKLAKKTRIWHVAHNEANILSNDGRVDSNSSLTQQVEINTSDLMNFFSQCEQDEIYIQDLFRNLPLIKVSHESLCHRYEEVIENVQLFTGVKSTSIKPRTKQQETRSLWEVVTNWEEVRNYLSNTKWAWMLQ